MNVRPLETERISELIAALSIYGVRFLIPGGSSESPPDGPTIHDLARVDILSLALARSSDARIQSSLVALLLRHAEYAPEIELAARRLTHDDPARRLVLLSIVVAASLQSNWSYALGLYLGSVPKIQADHIANELGLPDPTVEFGRTCLRSAAVLLREGSVFPVNYEADWSNTLHRLLSQLARETRQHDT